MPLAAHSAPLKPAIVVPPEMIGKMVKHKLYGIGRVTGISGTIILVDFNSVGEKKLGYEACMKNKLIEFI